MTITLANSLVEQTSLGTGFASPFTLDPATQDLGKVTGEENVDACILNILNISVGECVMNEDMGVDIMPQLFRSQRTVIELCPMKMQEAILRYEPRVKNVGVTAEAFGETGVIFRVTRTIRATGKTNNLVYPYYLEPQQGGVEEDG
jgi:phage baseplate assembly protein W